MNAARLNTGTMQEPKTSCAPIVIMAGGTGGHIFPALAVAKVLQAQDCPVVWIGTPNSMEAKLVPQHQIPMRTINIKGLRGKGLKVKLLFPLRVLKATVQAMLILRDIKPAAVVGMGGYVTGPGGIAAWLLRKPLIIHEQNAVAGMTNRYLARVARHVFEAFPNSFGEGMTQAKSIQCVGNPIRAEIMQLHEQEKNGQEKISQGKMNNEKIEFNQSRPLRLLVVGGSLGAQVLNQTVPLSIATLIADKVLSNTSIEIRHQTGEQSYAQALQAYQEAGVKAELVKFIDDMADAYSWADVIICRAGALTVSEVSAAGLPAIFIPLPHAVDDHQRKNAEALASAGAAEVIIQSELSAARLAHSLSVLFNSPERLNDMRKQSRSAAKLQATSLIAAQCLAYAKEAA